jgi:dihydrofolate reductase
MEERMETPMTSPRKPSPGRNCRTVTASIVLSLDGRVCGTDGPYDMSWIVPHAVSDGAHEHTLAVTSPATTILLGRINYEGFGSYWPGIADRADADPWDRAFSQWLTETDKVVFSTTLSEAAWQNTTIESRPPPTAVAELRAEPGGDIVVLASSSVIRALLDADMVDRLAIMVAPETVGGGPRLFDDTVTAAGSWSLTSHSITATGALSLIYTRAR